MNEIAVCDNNSKDRERLIERIIKNEDGNNNTRVHEYEDGEQLLKAMKKIVFSAIFLDIQMKGQEGDKTAVHIRNLDTSVVLVFYTNFAKLSPQRIETQPYRYIIKSMPTNIIDAYISATLKKIEENSRIPSLAVTVNRIQYVIRADQIIYIEKFKKGTRIHLIKHAQKKYNIMPDKSGRLPDIRHADKLETIYGRLQRYGFGRPHDSYIVNFNFLITSTFQCLKMEGVEGEFRIARSKSKIFNEQKNHFLSTNYVGRGGD